MFVSVPLPPSLAGRSVLQRYQCAIGRGRGTQQRRYRGGTCSPCHMCTLQPWDHCNLRAPAHMLLQQLLVRAVQATAAHTFRGSAIASTGSSSTDPIDTAVAVMDSQECEKLYYICGYLVSTLIVRVFKRIRLPQRRLLLMGYVKILEALKVRRTSPAVPHSAARWQRVGSHVCPSLGVGIAGKNMHAFAHHKKAVQLLCLCVYVPGCHYIT